MKLIFLILLNNTSSGPSSDQPLSSFGDHKVLQHTQLSLVILYTDISKHWFPLIKFDAFPIFFYLSTLAISVFWIELLLWDIVILLLSWSSKLWLRNFQLIWSCSALLTTNKWNILSLNFINDRIFRFVWVFGLRLC